MMNSVASGSWDPKKVPWVRDALEEEAFSASGYAQCYFCGAMSAKLSVADNSLDTGRVEVYCDNQACSAREMTVLVTRDGAGAIDRADSRLLLALDDGNTSTETQEPVSQGFGELIADQGRDARAFARRSDTGPASYAAPGRW